MSKREETVFITEYNKWLKDLYSELVDYRKNMVQVMNETKLKTFKNDKSFIDTSKQAFFHKLLCYYQQEAAMEEVNSII